MDAFKPGPNGTSLTVAEASRRYRDLRAHNERRTEVARAVEAQRRTRIERALEAARQRRKIDFV